MGMSSRRLALCGLCEVGTIAVVAWRERWFLGYECYEWRLGVVVGANWYGS